MSLALSLPLRKRFSLAPRDGVGGLDLHGPSPDLAALFKQKRRAVLRGRLPPAGRHAWPAARKGPRNFALPGRILPPLPSFALCLGTIRINLITPAFFFLFFAIDHPEGQNDWVILPLRGF